MPPARQPEEVARRNMFFQSSGNRPCVAEQASRRPGIGRAFRCTADFLPRIAPASRCTSTGPAALKASRRGEAAERYVHPRCTRNTGDFPAKIRGVGNQSSVFARPRDLGFGEPAKNRAFPGLLSEARPISRRENLRVSETRPIFLREKRCASEAWSISRREIVFVSGTRAISGGKSPLLRRICPRKCGSRSECRPWRRHPEWLGFGSAFSSGGIVVLAAWLARGATVWRAGGCGRGRAGPGGRSPW